VQRHQQASAPGHLLASRDFLLGLCPGSFKEPWVSQTAVPKASRPRELHMARTVPQLYIASAGQALNLNWKPRVLARSVQIVLEQLCKKLP